MIVLLLAPGITVVNPCLEIEFGGGLDRQPDARYGHRVDGRVGEIVTHQGKDAEMFRLRKERRAPR